MEELKICSKPLVQSFAWDSLSVGSQKVYTLNWKLFSIFGMLHGCEVNKFKWDFSFVCEYLLFRIQNSGSIHSAQPNHTWFLFLGAEPLYKSLV